MTCVMIGHFIHSIIVVVVENNEQTINKTIRSYRYIYVKSSRNLVSLKSLCHET